MAEEEPKFVVNVVSTKDIPAHYNVDRSEEKMVDLLEFKLKINANMTPFDEVSLSKCIQDLSLVGYHRARARPPICYDRVMGGIVWMLNKLTDRTKPQDFVECPQGQTLRKRTYECDNILTNVHSLHYGKSINIFHLLEQDYAHIVHLVRFLCRKLLDQDGNINNYCEFTEFFTEHYKSSSEAAADFERRVNIPSDNRQSDSDHFDKFDQTILHVKNLSAISLMAEYICYSRTGERIYPRDFDDGYMRVQDEEELAQLELEKRTSLKVLERWGGELYAVGKGTTVEDEHVRLYEIVDDLDIANTIQSINSRFAVEGADYWLRKGEYNEMLAQFETLALHADAANIGRVHGMDKKIDEMRSHCQLLYDCLSKDVEREYNLEVKMYANKNAKGKLQKYCPYKREAADKQHEKRLMIAKAARHCLRMNKNLGIMWRKYNRGLKNPIVVELPPEEQIDEEQEEQFLIWDDTLVQDIKELLNKVTMLISQLTHAPETTPEEEWIEEYRDSLLAILADYRNVLNDRYWKAYWLFQYRKTLLKNYRSLQNEINEKKVSVMVHARHFKNLMQVNKAIVLVKLKLREYEELSLDFQTNCKDCKI